MSAEGNQVQIPPAVQAECGSNSTGVDVSHESLDDERKSAFDSKIKMFKLDLEKIEDLPAARFRKRYGVQGEEYPPVLEDIHVKELLALNGLGVSDTELKEIDINTLLEILASGLEAEKSFKIVELILEQLKEKPQIIDDFQIKITENIKKNEVSLSLFYLLGELCGFENFKISQELIVAIEEKYPSKVLKEQLAVLNRINNDSGNRTLHKILDYFSEHLFALQNDKQDEMCEESQHFYANLHYNILHDEQQYSKNYLVKKHLQDQTESLDQVGNYNKKGAISGIAGGTSDKDIYLYSHTQEAYQNRIALGINEGYTIANPILQVAPGYFGYYAHDGKLSKVFKGKDNPVEKFVQISSEQIEKNNHEYEYIYDVLNEPDDLGGRRYSDDSYKLNKFHAIWEFSETLKINQEVFFFDISKIDFSNLHPVVNADILHRNMEYLKLQNLLPGADPLSDEEINDLISLRQDGTEEDLYSYKYLCRLDMRKKIEDDFGIDISKYNFSVQKAFLEFLESREVDNVEKLQKFVKEFGTLGMRTFLALERGDEDLGNLIIKFGTEHRELAEKVFAYYSDLLDSADRAEELVEQSTPYNDRERDIIVKMLGMKQDTQKLAEKIPSFFEEKKKELSENIRENLLGRAQKDFERALKAGDPTKIEELIKTYDVHAKEYVALLQEVGAGNIEKKSANELSPEDKEGMFSLLQENYQKTYPGEEYKEFVDMVQESLQKSFTNANTTFRILRDKGKIVSFNRFDTIAEPEGREKTYFGSFNADPVYSGVGSAMLEKTIQERLKDGRVMIGNCDTNQPVTRKYIESGFIATSFFTASSGIPAFEIQRTQDTATRFKTKTMTIEELLALTDTFYTVRKQEVEETYPEIQEGKVLTRYFEHNKEMYVVFEEL